MGATGTIVRSAIVRFLCSRFVCPATRCIEHPRCARIGRGRASGAPDSLPARILTTRRPVPHPSTEVAGRRLVVLNFRVLTILGSRLFRHCYLIVGVDELLGLTLVTAVFLVLALLAASLTFGAG